MVHRKLCLSGGQGGGGKGRGAFLLFPCSLPSWLGRVGGAAHISLVVLRPCGISISDGGIDGGRFLTTMFCLTTTDSFLRCRPPLIRTPDCLLFHFKVNVAITTLKPVFTGSKAIGGAKKKRGGGFWKWDQQLGRRGKAPPPRLLLL